MSNWGFLWILILFGLNTFASRAEVQAPADSTNGWGYGYDSLLQDISIWRKSPYVKVDSIGATVKGRALWMISITDGSDSLALVNGSGGRKHRVMIHARTHPSEVQANHIANEAIKFLLDSTFESAKLRAGYIFNIIPMYNPDGVELGYGRQNANRIDLESNWDKPSIEPEVQALRELFRNFMSGPIPIEVALNLHSDKENCTRFFFFHLAAGTSEAYVNLEKDFIAKAQSNFPGGIKDWNFVASWGDGTQARYPEGFWWLNHQEAVLALTYEDTNCPNASRFDSTARALVLGSADYIRGRLVSSIQRFAKLKPEVKVEAGGIRILGNLGQPYLRWSLADIRGRHLLTGSLASGEKFIPLPGLGGDRKKVLSLMSRGGSAYSTLVSVP